MELRFFARQFQYVNLQQQPIIYVGSSPSTLQPTQGTVDSVWHDFTSNVINLDDIKFQWAIDRNEVGEVQSGALAPKKSVSGNLTIDGAAYDYIKAWLINNVAANLNSIEVKIQDTSCGFYETYQIKSTSLTWCENDTCEFDVTLKQLDDQYSCIQKTIISDNWQGWFQWNPAGGKKHPRFSYCNEKRPNGMLVITWWITAMLEIVLAPLVAIVIIIMDVIIAIYNAVAQVLSWLSFGAIDPPDWNNFIDPSSAFDYFQNIMLESCGCGREHPSPLIRDYISNVCDKCGVIVDLITCPIFFSPKISMTTSAGHIQDVFNPHYNACYFYAPIHRGVRRFKSIYLWKNPDMNNEDFFIPDNNPIDSLDKFLDKLKVVYNAEWRIKGGKLYFWRKDWYTDQQFLYDFSQNSADREKILEGICFESSELKAPASVQGLYSTDSIDTCGDESLSYMNATMSFDPNTNNPVFDGVSYKVSNSFGGTKFRLDGAATDYIYDTIQVVSNGSILAPPLVKIFKDLDSILGEYANYALLLRDENTELAKIIIWDGESFTNAKAIRNVVPVNNDLVPVGNPIPEPNPEYPFYDETNNNNPYWSSWIDKHPAFTDIKGAALTPGSSDTGVYEARNYAGSLILHNAARLCNYPMFFEPHYKGTLWDWFHWIDDPRRNPSMNMTWNLKMELCCEDIKKLNALGDASNIELLAKVKLPFLYHVDGIITEIEISYDSSDRNGKYIGLRGKM